MTDRDEKILKHIGRYRLSIRPVIEQLFFDGKSCDHVMQRLTEEKRIQIFGPLPGNFSYYQLSHPEAARLGFPKNRVEDHTERPLREALAVLWFACMKGKERTRLLRSEAKKFLKPSEKEGLGIPHCVERPSYTIHRLYAPHPKTQDTRLLARIKRHLERARKDAQLEPLLAAGSYKFTVLVETPKRLARLETLLHRQAGHDWPVSIELVPGLHGLTTATKKGNST